MLTNETLLVSVTKFSNQFSFIYMFKAYFFYSVVEPSFTLCPERTILAPGYHWVYSFSSLILRLWCIYQLSYYWSYGRQHSMGSCESGKRWQLKGQFKLIRLRAWLHCCSAVEQMDWHGCRTPLWGLQWGKNIPHTSRRKDSKQASSISTCNNIRTNFPNKKCELYCWSRQLSWLVENVFLTLYLCRIEAASLWSETVSQMFGKDVRL